MPLATSGERMLTDLDEALERLQACDFEFGEAGINQGSVAVVALDALGHPSLIPFFVDVYVPRLRPLESGAPLPEAARARALGDRARRADWLATFEAELGEHGPAAVLATWVPILLPGAFAAAGTGALRAATGLRALAEADEALGRRELAFGLAHWASRHQILPGDPGVQTRPGHSVADALVSLEVAVSDRRRIGPMSEAVLVLEGDAGFASGLAAIDLHAKPAGEAIVEAVERLATLQLAQPGSRAIYGQAIKVAMALYALLAHLPPPLHAEVVARVAQVVLAIHGVYGTSEPGAVWTAAEDDERDALADDVDELRYRAACSREEHAITVAEACLAAHAQRPSRVLLQAAADAALRFEGGHAGRGG